jgi:hypothetical protein
MHKKGGRLHREKTAKKKQMRKTGEMTSEKTEERTQKKNQEQREERLKRGGEGEHSPTGAYTIPFAFAFGFTR